MEPTIYFATDHAGFELKNILVPFVRDELGFEVIDCGSLRYDEQDDFTEYIAKAARAVSSDSKNSKAIILGGSGQGEAMLANRFHDVRAAVYYGGSEEIVTLSRKHNDANVLSLGARFLTTDEAKKAVALWLETPHVPAEKYDRRIDDIEVQSTQQEGPVVSIAPSLPAQSFEEIVTLLDSLRGTATEVQIDMVDGVFVPFVSWPFTENDVQAALEKLSPYAHEFALEVDCMCIEPLLYLQTFVTLGVKRVIVHAGTTELYSECVAHAKSNGYKIGLGILNSTPRAFVEEYAHLFDFVQVMGIEHIGVQGQPFDIKTLETVRSLRTAYPTLPIAVDGGVNADTIVKLKVAGANRFAPGSFVSKSLNPVASYKHLTELIGL
jgi:ribose 5-phosphate isomerase B